KRKLDAPFSSPPAPTVPGLCHQCPACLPARCLLLPAPPTASRDATRSGRPSSGDCPQLLPGHEGSPPRHLGWPQRPRTPPPTPPHPTPKELQDASPTLPASTRGADAADRHAGGTKSSCP
ncbi:unnamed protein product, partial [Bubo scandiacus]